MTTMISASVTAGTIFRSTEGIVIMAGRLYIHELTPEVAKQWLPIITEIAGEKGPKTPESRGFLVE